jgi:hypothetical protein
MNNEKKEPRSFKPGPDNKAIVDRLVSITAHSENHAKVRRRKDGSLVISAVFEKMVS